MAVTKWSNVAIAMQSALGVAKTISGITKAAPGVVSATHDFANGDFIVMDVQGMWQLNARVFRLCNVVGTTTFQLEDVSGGTGISTAAFDTFTSGTAQKITFGSSISTATSMSASGGNFAMIDTTTIHGNQKAQVPGLPDALSMTFDNLWDPTDAGQAAMKTASDAQAKRAFKFTFGTGGKIMAFNGYVGFAGAPAGSAQDKITTQAVITCEGTPTYYSA
jgi:hypothetical protein